MSAVALDTSAAVPLLLRSHPAHRAVAAHVAGADARLTGHSLAETFSVLTRLPGDARLDAADAATLLAELGQPLLPEPVSSLGLASIFARRGVVGGAVHDGLVALAASDAEVPLVSRDGRALPTYRALGVVVQLVAE